MRHPRESTIKVIELAEMGVLTWEAIARECLSYMSESEVADMAGDWIGELEEEEETEEEGGDDDDWDRSPHYADGVQFDGESPRKPEV